MLRTTAFGVERAGVGAVREQKSFDLAAAGVHGLVQRGELTLLAGIDVGPCRDHGLDDFERSARNRGMNGRYPHGVARRFVDLNARTRGEQTLQRGVLSEERRQREWVEAVGRPRGCQRGIERQQHVEVTDPSERGRIEDVQIATGADERLDDLVVASVARRENGRHAVGSSARCHTRRGIESALHRAYVSGPNGV